MAENTQMQEKETAEARQSSYSPREHKTFKKSPRVVGKFKSFTAAFMQGNGQNDALQFLKDNKYPINIFLVTGVKFDGIISDFDQYTISITDSKNHQQMIYKDKISTLTLKKPEHSSRPRVNKFNPSYNSAKVDAGGNLDNGNKSFERKIQGSNTPKVTVINHSLNKNKI